jgi:hypothetical protein
MSELITKQPATGGVRWQLLSTVSALAICGTIYTGDAARAGDAGRPTVWIELGGQLERVDSGQDAFLPPFLTAEPRPGFETESPASLQRPPRYALGGEAKFVFAPDDSDWRFSAALRFGRSNNGRHIHQQTTQSIKPGGLNFARTAPLYADITAFGDTDTSHAERHAIADFMVGRDVGVGLWGRGSSSVFSFGVRFAQFTARNANTLREAPDPFMSRYQTGYFLGKPKYKTNTHHHSFYAQGSIWRSFSGVGPTISMSGSQPFAGNEEAGEISFDWGANAAVLFGRQKAHGSHKTSGQYFTNHATPFGFVPKSAYSTPPKPISRARSVVVPNIGGFAGLAFHRANAKVSFGYRADFFFGAMDAGIDARHAKAIGFHGPFATISIGLGG